MDRGNSPRTPFIERGIGGSRHTRILPLRLLWVRLHNAIFDQFPYAHCSDIDPSDYVKMRNASFEIEKCWIFAWRTSFDASLFLIDTFNFIYNDPVIAYIYHMAICERTYSSSWHTPGTGQLNSSFGELGFRGAIQSGFYEFDAWLLAYWNTNLKVSKLLW